MTKSIKLIIAAIAFIIYGAVVLYSGLPGNIRSAEDKLDYSANTKLSRLDPNKKVSVELNGQVATLTGVTNSEVDRKDIIKSVKSSRWGGGIIVGGVTKVRADGLKVSALPPKPLPPFRWAAEKSQDGVTLVGMVPDETTRNEIVAYAEGQFPNGVTDRMNVARGAPAGDWLGAAKIGLNSLSRLNSGRVTGNGSEFVVSGRAESREVLERVNERFSKLPSDYTGEVIVTVPGDLRVQSPYDWSATMGPGNAPVILTGYVPSRNAGDKIVAHARTIMTNRRVIDRQVVANGVPEGPWEDLVSTNLNVLSQLKSGNITGRDNKFVISGITDDNAVVDESRIKIEALGNIPFNTEIDIDVVAPPVVDLVDECQTLFDNAMRNNTINFQTSKAIILPDSKALLDRLGVAAKRCRNFEIEIAGHTDSSGSAELNQSLSVSRAQAVVRYLIGEGVNEGQLKARGYGETTPIADNSTDEGKAQNRRIEFTIKTKKGS